MSTLMDLGRENCSCRAWLLKGVPYAYVIAVYTVKNYDSLDYIDNYYSKKIYLTTYAIVFQPVTNMKMWPI